MRAMSGRRAGGIGLLATGLVVGSLIALVAPGRTAPEPAPSGPPVSTAPPVGPIVFYELLDAAGSSLMERRLDGQSPARVVSVRTDVDYGRTWAVDPTGGFAVAVIPDATDQELVGVAIAGGATVWRTRTPIAPVDGAVWSADGGRFAIATVGGENEAREVVVVEASTGRFVRSTIPEDSVLQGFDSAGGLILRRRLPAPQATTAAWGFLRFDPATTRVEQLTAPPDVGPASGWSEDVHPGVGVGVDQILGDGDQGTSIRLWNLAGGAPRQIAAFASVDRLAIDPAGAAVAIGVADTIRLVAFDGRARDLYSGADPIADFGWSAGGDYLGVATDRPGPNLTVIETGTGRSVLLPQPDPVAQSLLVRIVGGRPLPTVALPADEPKPTPTPGPSGPDVAGFGGMLSAWIERTATDTDVLHVQRVVPTDEGGLRVAASMPPVELGPGRPIEDGEWTVILLPRPASAEVLAWVQAGDDARGWLWDGLTGPTPLILPPDWPALAVDLAWRPDGKALAASASAVSEAGDFVGTFVVAELGATTTNVVPIVGDYDRLEGWWSRSELRVGHGICTEGCDGRYAYAARLRIADRRLIQLTPADRSVQPIDLVWFDGDAIRLSMINDDPTDDVAIDWPDAGRPDGVEPIGFAADARTFLVAVRTAAGTDIATIDDPIGRAIGGRLRDPQPKVIGHLTGRGLRVEMSPDLAWALVTDRVEAVHLVRLADGRTWPLDRDRIFVWS